MSIEFEELEEPLTLVGSLIVAISSLVMTLLASFIGFTILGGSDIEYIDVRGDPASYGGLALGYSFFFIFLITFLVLILSLLSLLRNKMKFKVNVFVAAVFELVFFIFISKLYHINPLSQLLQNSFRLLFQLAHQQDIIHYFPYEQPYFS